MSFSRYEIGCSSPVQIPAFMVEYYYTVKKGNNVVRYALIGKNGECRVYVLEDCAKIYQQIFGGVIKEIHVGIE